MFYSFTLRLDSFPHLRIGNCNAVVSEIQPDEFDARPGGYDVEDWSKHFEEVAVANDWDKKSRIRKIGLYLKKGPKAWYDVHIGTKGEWKEEDWEPLLEELKKNFAKYTTPCAVQEKVDELTLRKDVPIMDYYWEKLRLINKYTPKTTEDQKVLAIIKGLPAKPRRKLDRQKISTLDRLRKEMEELNDKYSDLPSDWFDIYVASGSSRRSKESKQQYEDNNEEGSSESDGENGRILFSGRDRRERPGYQQQDRSFSNRNNNYQHKNNVETNSDLRKTNNDFRNKTYNNKSHRFNQTNQQSPSYNRSDVNRHYGQRDHYNNNNNYRGNYRNQQHQHPSRRLPPSTECRRCHQKGHLSYGCVNDMATIQDAQYPMLICQTVGNEVMSENDS